MMITEVGDVVIGCPVSPAADQDVNRGGAPAPGRAPYPSLYPGRVTEDQIHLTAATHDRLQAELEDLTTRGRVEIARAIEAARALGDLSENGDYHAAKDTQGKMEARIRQLQATLKTAVVVDGDSGGSGTVSAGTVVGIRYEGDDDVERFLVGSIEERHEELNVVSPGSPLGKALLGKGPGDLVEYEAPGGTLRVEIVEVG
jgi:transcription elongation factor GreA